MTPCENQNTTFFEKLQQTSGLDRRDRRGKRHDLTVVLLGVAIALLSNRDGNLSSIHRHLRNHYEKLCEVLGIEVKRAISRSQLPLCLEKVAVEEFDRLLFENYGVKLTEAEKQWFAVDGKELRGSIARGAKRGEAVVQAILQETGWSAAEEYYSGEKESEVAAVRELLKNSGLLSKKISFDALHLKPQTLEPIAESGGTYLVGLKDNQKQLRRQINRAVDNQAYLFKSSHLEKAHGRIERRSYEFYDILELEKDERWKKCQLRTVIEVKTETEVLRSRKRSRETSYYLTNEVGKYEELCGAVRGHWKVETRQSHPRCEFQGRSLAVKKKHLQRTMAGIRTLATTILNQTCCQNRKAQLENFSDNFDDLILTLKNLNFL